MSRDTSLTFRQAIHAQETSEAFLVLIEIDHDSLSEPIRLSSDAVNTVSNGNTYVAYPFDLVLPDDPEEGVSKGRLIIDNVHRDIIQFVRNLPSAPKVTIRIVLASNPDVIEAEFPNFELVNIQYDALTVSGDLSIRSFMSEPYPGDSFTPSLFPGLF